MMIRSGLVFGGLLLAALGFGQKMDPFDSHLADFRLLQYKNIQDDVHITTGQRATLNKLAERERATAQPYLDQMRREGKTASSVNTDPKYAGYILELRQNILAQLSPAQLKRLREISLQVMDLTGLCDVMVAKKVSMSVTQLTKVRALFQSAVKNSTEIVHTIDKQVLEPYRTVKVKSKAESDALNSRISKERSEALKKRKPDLDRIESETKRQLQSVLSAKQLAAYKSLQGKLLPMK